MNFSPAGICIAMLIVAILASERPELVQRLHKKWQDWSETLPPRVNLSVRR